MRKLLVLLALAVTAGCVKQAQEYFAELNRTGEGIFRGINIKDSVKKIKQQENGQFLEVDETIYLKYNYPFDEKDTLKGHYEIEYYFDGSDKLHEVIVNIFIPDKQRAGELYEAFVNKFTGEYGDYKSNQEGYLIWQGKTATTNQLEIALTDDSKNNESTGYITLQINDFDY